MINSFSGKKKEWSTVLAENERMINSFSEKKKRSTILAKKKGWSTILAKKERKINSFSEKRKDDQQFYRKNKGWLDVSHKNKNGDEILRPVYIKKTFTEIFRVACIFGLFS